MVITGRSTDRDISSEWPRRIVGKKGYNINPDSYKFKRGV
jgi:hypothetical protein